jgi:hypothetical protein
VSAPRVALIGARRARQGLGPFVARDLAAAGLEVAAVLGTSPESAAAAARELEQRCAIRARPYLELAKLLASEAPDALAILSPPETHEPFLRAALDARLHVLCEKPLVYGPAGFAVRGRALVDAFRARGLLLEENCQWPRVLDAFRRLHPGAGTAAPRAFAMLLAPVGRGREALRDSLSHPLSLLQALCPGPDAAGDEIGYEPVPGAPARLRVRFRYTSAGARVACSVDLLADDTLPRPAWLELDGRRAERRIRASDYRMELTDGARAVPRPDPLTAHLARVAENLRAVLAGATPPDPAPIARRLALLSSLVDAFPIELQD